jgi:hypothetical protein
MNSAILLALFGAIICHQMVDASRQSVAVQGWLRCRNDYAGGVVSILVELFNYPILSQSNCGTKVFILSHIVFL